MESNETMDIDTNEMEPNDTNEIGPNGAYPETLIIVITAHGKIEVDTTFDGRKEPDIFGIPYGMTLTRINAVTTGVCNYLSTTIAKKIVERTKEVVAIHDLANKSSIPPYFVKYLSNELKRLANTDRQNINSEEEDDEETAYIKAYNTHYNKAYTTATHRPYTFALNKIYTIEELSRNYNNKILLLNTPEGEVDYFTTLRPPYRVDLKTLVLTLAEQGVKNILLIDLSCAGFDDKSLTPRDERAMRREAHNEGWWGGKKKRKNKNKGTKKKGTKRGYKKRTKKRIIKFVN
jgi:hypothetical protein